jgi:hypothetical protein
MAEKEGHMIDGVPFFLSGTGSASTPRRVRCRAEKAHRPEGSHSNQELSAIQKGPSSGPLEHAGKLAPVRQGCQQECPVSPAANARL